MSTNHKNQLIAFASMQNLNYLIEFHNHVRNSFKAQVHDLKNSNISDQEKKRYKNTLHNFDRSLNANTFLMMYSYLEEWLYHHWKAHAPNVELRNTKGSIARFKNVVKHLGVDVSLSYWQTIMSAESIRNCLLHANGRISLLKNSQKVKDTINKKDSKLTIKMDRIVISSEYLHDFSENISNFMDTISNPTTQ